MRPGLAVAVACLLLPAPASAGRPALRGVIEGYYGRPWSGADRRDVIRFLGRHRLTTFVYAPKNDDLHRARWREPYSSAALADLRATSAVARRAGVTFMYALSPVLDVCYSCAADRAALVVKLAQVAGARVRRFVLLFDDGGRIATPEDVARYGGSDLPALARAQADLVNYARRWLARHRLRLAFMVPSDYAGTECRPYHDELGHALRPGIPVGWTGAGVFADTITADQARARRRCVGDHPVVLWDNYPVNDTVLSNNLHLGPLTGREPGLTRALAGHLLNPMTQPHASLVALGTAAAYFRSPRRYDPEAAWHRTLTELGGGGDGLAILAEQVRSSALDLTDAEALAAVVTRLGESYASSDWTASVEDLDAEETRQAAAPGDIAIHLGSSPLASEIGPWVAELAAHAARGLEATRLLRAMKPAFVELTTISTSGRLVANGRVVANDPDTAAALGPGFAADGGAVSARIAQPPVSDFITCLGDFTSGDIRFCPEFGLNVHGKALFFRIDLSGVSVVSDRNIHDRLVLFAARAYTDWAGRRGPGADTLTLTFDGAPVALEADFTFSTSFPASGGTFVLSTAAGEATARTVR